MVRDTPFLGRFRGGYEGVEHSQATRYVAEFMLQTGLLGQFRHVEIEPEPPNGGNENDLPG
jgi:hypothetical protein